MRQVVGFMGNTVLVESKEGVTNMPVAVMEDGTLKAVMPAVLHEMLEKERSEGGKKRADDGGSALAPPDAA